MRLCSRDGFLNARCGLSGRIFALATDQLVGVAVAVMMIVSADSFEFGRCAAAVCGLAAGDLELDRCVGDMEAVVQGALDAVQYGAALGHGHLGDGDVAGECV